MWGPGSQPITSIRIRRIRERFGLEEPGRVAPRTPLTLFPPLKESSRAFFFFFQSMDYSTAQRRGSSTGSEVEGAMLFLVGSRCPLAKGPKTGGGGSKGSSFERA